MRLHLFGFAYVLQFMFVFAFVCVLQSCLFAAVTFRVFRLCARVSCSYVAARLVVYRCAQHGRGRTERKIVRIRDVYDAEMMHARKRS